MLYIKCLSFCKRSCHKPKINIFVAEVSTVTAGSEAGATIIPHGGSVALGLKSGFSHREKAQSFEAPRS